MSKIITTLTTFNQTTVNSKYFTSVINSITGVVDIDINNDCSSFDITDNSNFDVENAHDQSHFSSYRKITITEPDGTTRDYSSLLDASDSYYVLPASSDLTISVAIEGGDGIYNIRMCNIPTWVTNVTYAEHDSADMGAQDVVYNKVGTDDKFYKCKLNHTSSASSEPGVGASWATYWDEVSEGDFDLDDEYPKYCDEEYIMIHCDLDSCIQDLTAEIFCGDNKIDFCTNDLPCNEHKYMKFLKLYSLRHSMDIAFAGGDTHHINEMIKLTNKLCNCA